MARVAVVSKLLVLPGFQKLTNFDIPEGVAIHRYDDESYCIHSGAGLAILREVTGRMYIIKYSQSIPSIVAGLVTDPSGVTHKRVAYMRVGSPDYAVPYAEEISVRSVITRTYRGSDIFYKTDSAVIVSAVATSGFKVTETVDLTDGIIPSYVMHPREVEASGGESCAAFNVRETVPSSAAHGANSVVSVPTVDVKAPDGKYTIREGVVLHYDTDLPGENLSRNLVRAALPLLALLRSSNVYRPMEPLRSIEDAHLGINGCRLCGVHEICTRIQSDIIDGSHHAFRPYLIDYAIGLVASWQVIYRAIESIDGCTCCDVPPPIRVPESVASIPADPVAEVDLTTAPVSPIELGILDLQVGEHYSMWSHDAGVWVYRGVLVDKPEILGSGDGREYVAFLFDGSVSHRCNHYSHYDRLTKRDVPNRFMLSN